MMVVDYIFATYLIVFEFKEFSPFLNLFMSLAFLYNLYVNHYLFCYQSILSGCKKTQKSVCIEREEDSSQQPIKQFFWFIFFPIVQISSQKLANVSFSCQDSGTFALAHINVVFFFFRFFFPFSCVLSAAEQQIPLCLISNFLILSFFHTKVSFLLLLFQCNSAFVFVN